MASRSETRANDAVKELREAGVLEKGSVEVLLMDLNSLKDVKRAADEFAAKEPKLHILGQRGKRSTSPAPLTKIHV